MSEVVDRLMTKKEVGEALTIFLIEHEEINLTEDCFTILHKLYSFRPVLFFNLGVVGVMETEKNNTFVALADLALRVRKIFKLAFKVSGSDSESMICVGQDVIIVKNMSPEVARSFLCSVYGTHSLSSEKAERMVPRTVSVAEIEFALGEID